MAGKKQIVIQAENCSGCSLCSLACSFFTTTERAFNSSEARIVVRPGGTETWFTVDLLPDCDGCGICVHYCAFDALSILHRSSLAAVA